MTSQTMLAAVEAAYEAWNAGRYEELLAGFDGGFTWVVPGQSAFAGKQGRPDEVVRILEAMGRAEYEVSPRHYIADDERVVALVQASFAGKPIGAIDVWTFEDGKLAKYQHASTNTTVLDSALSGE